MKNTELQITGMTCTNCSARIEKALRRMEGVREASVSLATSTAVVQWDGSVINDSAIIGRIRQLGYEAEVRKRDGSNVFDTEAKALRNRFVATFVLSLPLLIAMIEHIPFPIGIQVPVLFTDPIIQLLIGSILVAYAGYPFFSGAYQALKQGMPNMDVLVAMSVMAAYLYSHYQVFHPGTSGSGEHLHPPVYFDSIAMILTAVTLGKWLEAVAKGNAMRSLTSLYKLQSETARIVRADGTTERIPASGLAEGDRVAANDQEWIPADGVILEGSAEIDESLLSGESLPIFKTRGERVYAGTRLVSGHIVLRTLSPASHSRLSRMIAAIEKAQQFKPRIQRRVDHVAAYFVPAILLLTILTFVGWSFQTTSGAAFSIAMAVLLVACPCALGLATPISILIGSSRSGKAGIIIKEGSALETLSRANLFVFDKTGTITSGKPVVSEIRAKHVPPAQLLKLAASLEQYSDHPYAKAIVKEANGKHLLLSPARDAEEQPGQGIRGFVGERRVVIGRPLWLTQQGISLPNEDALRETGQGMASELYVAIDGKYAGSLVLRDQIQEAAKTTVQWLSRHAEVWMASGDRESTTKQIASEAGIQHMKSEMYPEQKLELIQQLQQQGRRVVMVGDGANDSAALAAADVGIAMAGGNDAAMQAGDIVIAGGRISQVKDAFIIAKQTMRNIKQNLLIALIYNTVMIPLAVMGLLDPRVACIGMALSSILVVGNASRLVYNQSQT